MALSGFRAVLSRAMPDPAAALHRLQPGDLRVGEPLPFDLYDGTGRRLVQAGVVIAEDAQLERLLARGIHCDAERFEALKAAPPGAAGTPHAGWPAPPLPPGQPAGYGLLEEGHVRLKATIPLHMHASHHGGIVPS